MQTPIATLAAWFTAIGTLAVAVAAIWGDWIRACIAGPRLTLSLRERGHLTPRTDGGHAIFYHVAVGNDRSWSPAKAVRLLVVGIAKRRPDGSYLAEPLIAPFQLTWAFPEFHELFPTVADPHHPEICDLGYLDERARQFKLSTYIQASTFPGWIASGEAMRVTLVASAHNGQSEPLVVEISWDGVWPENLDEMQKHLVVNEAASARML